MYDKSKILIVDDTKTNIDILIEFFDDKYDLLIALDGHSALEIANKERVDLILLDIMMPEIDGYEVCEILKSQSFTKDIPVIFITAKVDDDSIKKAYEVGGNDYVTKPFKLYELLARVKIQLDMQKLIVDLKKSINEVKHLNINLEERVKVEVAKNKLQYQQMLNQSRQAQMGEMISMIAHQWRQPLGAISATSGNLQLKIELEDFDFESKNGVKEAIEYFTDRLENINGYVKNLTTTIDDFRNFYKPNKKLVTVKLEDIIVKSLDIIKASLINDNIEIIEEYNSQELIELYDSEMMQVILNILKNSQDNFKEKQIQNPKITITINEKTISICDNGGGIPEDIVRKIFDSYFSTKNEKNGTGLGLYMSKTIVENHHHGTLIVENIYDGVCFIIRL